MTRSVFILGGAGAGKSTFMAALLQAVGAQLRPLEDVYSVKNSRDLTVPLRGHPFTMATGRQGLYLGVMREHHPGADGLVRQAYMPGEVWLREGNLPDALVSEGLHLAARRFLAPLHEETDLLVVHLQDPEWLLELRLAQRGTDQGGTFVQSTRTAAANRARELRAAGARVLHADTEDPDAYSRVLDEVRNHLTG